MQGPSTTRAGFRNGELSTTEVENAASSEEGPIHRTTATRVSINSSEDEDTPPLVMTRRLVGMVPTNPPNPQEDEDRRQ